MPDDEPISVIIPTQRRPRRLWDALRSVGAQTYPAVTAIVVNDGGVPVGDIVARYHAEFGRPAELIDLPAVGGLANARNVGLRAAQGPIIALLDDDDRFRPTHLARLAAALRDHPEAALVYDDVLIQVEDGTEADGPGRVVATCRFGRPYDRATFDRDDFIVPSAAVFRRAAAEAAGGFDTVIPMCEDWDFLLRLRDHGALRYVPGAIGVDYSLRTGAGDNLGSRFDARRRLALDMLAARYNLSHLDPKTFLDVARDLGFTIEPAATPE